MLCSSQPARDVPGYVVLDAPAALRNTPVRAILQSRQGFMWFGTDRGLVRYDGTRTLSFRSDPEQPTSLTDDRVTALCEDPSGALWVGTANGLGRLDSAGRSFRNYRRNPQDPRSLSDDRVEALHCSADGRVWVGTFNWSGAGGGLNLLNPGSSSFQRFLHDPADPASLSDNRVRSIAGNSSGRLWVGTWRGLNEWDPRTGRFRRLSLPPAGAGDIGPGDVRSLLEDTQGRLWVGTLGAGLLLLDRRTGAFQRIQLPGGPLAGRPEDSVMALTEDYLGRIWVGTLNSGLLRMDPATGNLARVPVQSAATGGLSSRMVWSLRASREGVLWVGTEEGLNRMDLRARAFEVVRPGAAFDGQLTAALVDSEGRLWLGTSSNGLGRYAPRTAALVWFRSRPADSRSLCSDAIQALLEDRRGRIWVSTGRGLCRYEPTSDTFIRFPEDRPPGASLQDEEQGALLEDRAGNIWIGTRFGLGKLDLATGVIRRYLESEQLPPASRWVQALHEARDGTLWIGTLAGIRSLPAGASVSRAVSPQPVASFWEDAAGAIWAAGHDGLIRIDRSGRTAQRYSHRNTMLPDDQILNVVGDRAGRLWLTTAEALLRFDPVSGFVKSYANNVPLGRGRFLENSARIDSAGRIAVAASLGVVRFDPRAEAGNPVPPQVAVTAIRPLAGPPASEALPPSSSLELPYSRRDFTVEFAALHFADPRQNVYAFMLENYDSDWLYAGNRQTATYTSLPPGRYVFRVKAASSDNVWSPQSASFAISILPPWWRTWPAYAAYALGVLGLLWAVRRFELNRFHLENRLKEHRLEAEYLRELDQSRSRLLANVSHELRTPLTMILGQVGRALGHGCEPHNRPRLEMALRNARQLQHLIDQLLDLSRLEAGAVHLNPVRGDLNGFTADLTAGFQELAEEGRVSLSFQPAPQPVPALYEPEKLGTILSNLVSNALKYTPPGGSVDVRVAFESGAGEASISVEDTGLGIAEEELPRVFDRFFRAASGERSVPGTGIGLALARELALLHGGDLTVSSRLGAGSTFVLRLPLPPPAEAAVPVAPAGDRDLVLVIEDNPDLRSYIREELEAGYTVLVAAGGEEGLALAASAVPDLIVTDLMMPGLSGMEVLRRLREDLRTSHIPVIMLTAWSTMANRLESLGSGVDDFLPKPFSADELRARIANLIRNREQLRQRFSSSLAIRPSELQAAPLDRTFLERIAAVVESHFADEGFGVAQLCSEIGLSVSQLHRKLKALIGQTPAGLIRSMRLQRAADLIRSGAGSIAEIGYQTGFGDQAHFTRSFKQRFGCTPTEFKRRPS